MPFIKGHIGYTPKLTEEHKRKIKLAQIGKKLSDEHKKKIIESGTTFKKGHISFYKGKEFLAVKGEKNFQWKGDNVGYVSVHEWVSRWKGKPKKCENCGTEIAKKYEWANVDHKYRRVLKDYIRMCTTCHRKYDKDIGIKIN